MAADSDTIFALASGAGRAGVAVVRLSGATSGNILAHLAGAVPAARRAVLRELRSTQGTAIDRGVVLWLPGPGSYTGEDTAEFHVHGGRAVLRALTAALLDHGARPAESGEFSRRAFMHGRMGLLEAEAVADLVAAETEAQRLQAIRHLDGAQSDMVGGWAGRLRTLVAWQEALIDFPDEDLPAAVEAKLEAELAALRVDIERGIEDAIRGIRLREGVVVAVIGTPNVGKSSLVNALARRDVAIVSPYPGTTRDALEATLDLAGVPVTLIDTAGLRHTDDPVEAEGVRRARARAESADLVLEVRDASVGDSQQALPGRIVVMNKIDLAAWSGALGVSAVTGAGLDALRACLTERVVTLISAGADPVFTRARHTAALRDAASALQRAEMQRFPELRAEELRLSLAALGRMTGTVDVEAILDVVFSQFCIGK